MNSSEEGLKKECVAGRCKRKNRVVMTEGKYCTACGAKLKAVYDTRPAEIVEPDLDSPGSAKPLLNGHAGGAGFVPDGNKSVVPITVAREKTSDPTTFGEEMVLRKHYTVTEGDHWACWCGWKSEAAGVKGSGHAASEHDRLPAEMVALKDIPVGGRYIPMPAKEAAASAAPARSDNWGCAEGISDLSGRDVVGCPFFEEGTRPRTNKMGGALVLPRIEIPAELWEKWCHLAKKVKTEWLAYIIGEALPISEIAPVGGWKITGDWFPKQRVTTTHVDVAEESLRNLKTGTIGDIHSHVDMSAYFSAEDIRHFNHDVHLVLNAREQVDSSIRVMLDCHRTSRVKGSLILTGLEEEYAWEEELKEYILPPEPVVVSPAASASASAGQGIVTWQGGSSLSTRSDDRSTKTIGRYSGNQKQDTWQT